MRRVCVMPCTAFATAILIGLVAMNASLSANDGNERFYIGTYAKGQNDGIYVAELDLTTGTVSEPRLAAVAVNPSFVAIHPSGKLLYAVSEVSVGRKKAGGVSAYRIDEKSGRLQLLNSQSSQGADPCHLVVDKTGKNVLVANYSSGTVAVLPIDEKGRLKRASSIIQHQGKSINPERQEGPHAHSINLDPGNRYAFAADLGLDKVLIYRFDPSVGSLTANDPPAGVVTPGSGPRHFAFHPSGRYAYVINEMGNTLTVFSYDPEHGALDSIQTLGTLPADFKGTSYTAEVVAHPSGKFVYGSNRGHDSVAIFAVDPATGKLTPNGNEPTQGKNPRNIAVDPSGRYLLAENQDSDSIVIFRIDAESGRLKPTAQTLKVAKPVCIKFLTPKS